MRRSAAARLLVALVSIAGLCGCTGSRAAGNLHVRAATPEGVVLPSSYQTAVYAPTAENVASFWLTDAPLESLLDGTIERGQVVHIELLWTPRPGRTPLDPSAVNISIRHIVFVDGEVGVYGGAGFARLGGGVGAERLTLVIPESNLALLDASAGFSDILAPGILTGSFTATLNPGVSRRLGFAASQKVTNILNRTRWVRAEAARTTGGSSFD